MKNHQVVKFIEANFPDNDNPTATLLIKETDAGHVEQLNCSFPFKGDYGKMFAAKTVRVEKRDNKVLCEVVDIDNDAYQKRVTVLKQIDEQENQPIPKNKLAPVSAKAWINYDPSGNVVKKVNTDPTTCRLSLAEAMELFSLNKDALELNIRPIENPKLKRLKQLR